MTITKMTVTKADVYSNVIREMTREVHEINEANGWFDSHRSFGDDIALLHSEVSEAFEGYRKSDPGNVAEEMADILIRLLDTCDRYNIDLTTEFIAKCEKNRQRDYKHGGKVV